MSGGGGSSEVKYTQSPEQRQIMKAYMPMIEGMGQYGSQRYFGAGGQGSGGINTGAQGYGGGPFGNPMGDVGSGGQRARVQSDYFSRTGQLDGGQSQGGPFGNVSGGGGAPSQMGAPSMSGVLTGQQMYDIPDPSTAMPTQDWWNSLAPNVKAGLYAPYEEAGRGMLEMMGSRGQTGSAAGGYSGAAGAAMGELAGRAATDVGLNAWQMTAPMATNAWNANLNRNIGAYSAGQQERLGDYNTEMQVWNRPYESMMGAMGMSMPQAYTQQGGNQAGGALSGAMYGGMGMYGMSGGNPYLSGLGALGGGLAGYFS